MTQPTRYYHFCATCMGHIRPGLHHCQECLDAMPEPEPLKAEKMTNQDSIAEAQRRAHLNKAMQDCFAAVLEPEPLKAEALSMQLPQIELRDWFAGMALACLKSMRTLAASPEQDARDCYEMADAMLAARDASRPDEEPAPQKYPLGYEPQTIRPRHDVLKATDFGGI